MLLEAACVSYGASLAVFTVLLGAAERERLLQVGHGALGLLECVDLWAMLAALGVFAWSAPRWLNTFTRAGWADPGRVSIGLGVLVLVASRALALHRDRFALSLSLLCAAAGVVCAVVYDTLHLLEPGQVPYLQPIF